jgi:type IV secretion system protein VirB10
MTDTPTSDGPERSPDILSAPPKRGENVRRLNKKPLMFALAGASAIALVLVFTLNARAARPPEETGSAGTAATGAVTAARPDFMADAPQAGMISADGSMPIAGEGGVPLLVAENPNGVLTPDGQAGSQMPPPPQYANAPSGGGGGGYSRYSAEWEAYNQRRADMAQARYQRASSAMGADSSVQLPSRNGPGQQAGPSGGQGVGMPGMGAMQQPQAPAAGGGRPARGGNGINAQDDKRAFLSESGGQNPYAAGRVESAVSPNEVKAGTVIPATLITGVNSDLPGQLVAQVSRNVYDTATGRRLLIPQGARLVGAYDSGVTTGQSRVLVAWTRLIYPDGSSIDLGSMPGSDAGGYAGLRDRVDNHTRRVWGNALLLSLFSAGVQLSQPRAVVGQEETPGQVASAQLGQQLGQLGMEQARRGLQVQPTLQIRPGFNMNVQVTQDLILREWRPRRNSH